MQSDLSAESHKWDVAVDAELIGPGAARVRIQAANPRGDIHDWTVNCDWRAGQERGDVEAFALELVAVPLGLLVATLNAEAHVRRQGR